jgi:hypothetical protein
MPNMREIGAAGTMGMDVDDPMAPDTGASRSKKLQFVSAELKRMRYFRRQYDMRRAHYYRQYLSQRDERTYPDNITKRSNTFVPYPFSNVETIISRVLDAFFSMEDWFEVKDKQPYSTEDQADQMQIGLMDKLHKSKLISCFEELVRNLVIYGHAGIKVDWDFDFDIVTTAEPIYAQQPMLDPNTGQPAMDPMSGQPQMQNTLGPDGQPIVIDIQPKQEQVPRACPKFYAIDVYDLLVDPDGAYVAHLTERTWKSIKDEFTANPKSYFPDGIEMLEGRLANLENPDEVIIRLAEFWNKNDNTWTIMTFGEDPEGVSFKDLRASFRATSYSPYKRPMYGGESILLYDGDNPFAHKRAPILHTSFIKLPNEVFGMGAIEIITDLSEALNRFVNMISDNWNIGINHRFAYDINAEIDHEALTSFNIPGGKVGVVGKPADAIFPLPQFTPAAGDYQILDVYRGMIEMAAGVSDFYQKGVGGSEGNKTATGIQQIIGETNYRLKTFIRNLEIDILQPVLEMCASMLMQFVQQPFSVPNPASGVAGADGQMPPNSVMIDPKQLIGTYQFDIVASNYATSKVVRQRNLMALAQIISQSPFVNEYEALRELLKTFEIKHIDRLLKRPEVVQQEQQAQMQQQMMQEQIAHQMDLQKIKVQGDADAQVAAVSPSPIAASGDPLQPGHVPNSAGRPGGGRSSGRSRPPAGRKKKEGRKSKMQHEGKIPGAGLTTMARSMGAGMGAQGLGLEGTEG